MTHVLVKVRDSVVPSVKWDHRLEFVITGKKNTRASVSHDQDKVAVYLPSSFHGIVEVGASSQAQGRGRVCARGAHAL